MQLKQFSSDIIHLLYDKQISCYDYSAEFEIFY